MLTIWLGDKITQIIVISLLKGIDHPRVKILSFTHPCAIPNLNDFLSFADILKNVSTVCAHTEKIGGSETTLEIFSKISSIEEHKSYHEGE